MLKRTTEPARRLPFHEAMQSAVGKVPLLRGIPFHRERTLAALTAIQTNLEALRSEVRASPHGLAPPAEADVRSPIADVIPDGHAYFRYRGGQAVLHPWHLDAEITRLIEDLQERQTLTLVDFDRLWTLKWAFLQTAELGGEIWELGVYRGGSALYLKRLMSGLRIDTTLRLFDSFEGLPAPAGIDKHREGEFGDTSLAEVRNLVGSEPHIDYRKGWIPHTFDGLGDVPIRFAHIDLDLYQPILDATDFVYQRLVPGGIIVYDDYGFDSCPGARKAVDEFYADKPESPLYLPTGQAVIVRQPR